MVESKYSEFEIQIAEAAHALGHPSRFRIILAILANNNIVEGEIIHVNGMSKLQIRKHLNELQKAGFVSGRVDGAKCSYKVDLVMLYEFLIQYKKFLALLSE